MNIITWIALIIAIYAFLVAKNAHKRIDQLTKMCDIIQSTIWDTLLERGVINEEVYQDALDRFKKGISRK